MLRLQPSEITLTRREVVDFGTRMDLRRRMRLLQPTCGPAYITFSNNASTSPAVRRGPQRWPVHVRSDPSTSHPSSSFDSEVEQDEDEDEGESALEQTATDQLSPDGQSATHAPRRDSVLSYESRPLSGKPESNWVAFDDASVIHDLLDGTASQRVRAAERYDGRLRARKGTIVVNRGNIVKLSY